MRRPVLVLLATTIALVAVATPAHAGKAITKLATCPDQLMRYTGGADAKRYRAAVLCLMSAVRKSQHLNALSRSAQLEKAGQGWATAQAKSGAVSHGKSVNEIVKRIARSGYRADALNEGLGIGDPQGTPYDLVENMMEDFACTEILDPRFRDAGVGVSAGRLSFVPGGKGIHVVVEFGLKRGVKAPARNTRPAKTCPHRLPAPPSSPVTPSGAITPHEADVTLQVRCAAKSRCAFSATLKLAHAGSSSPLTGLELAAGETTTLVFAFAAADLQREHAASNPGVELTVKSTAPYAFDDVFSAPLP